MLSTLLQCYFFKHFFYRLSLIYLYVISSRFVTLNFNLLAESILLIYVFLRGLFITSVIIKI